MLRLLYFLISLFNLSASLIAQQKSPTIEYNLAREEVVRRGQRPTIIPEQTKTHTHKSLVLQNNLLPKFQYDLGLQSPNCTDSSFSKNLDAPQRVHIYTHSAIAANGGILIGGFGRSQSQGPPIIYSALLSKFDSVGNHIWTRELSSYVSEALYIESIKELTDGSIIISGWHDNQLYFIPPEPYQDLFVAKLTPVGDVIWFKTFHSSLNNNCTIHNARFLSVAEGANGDLLFTGTLWNCPSPKHLLVFKLNVNGDLQWQYAFEDPNADSYGAGIFFENNEVIVVNRASNVISGGDNIIHVDFLRLNYNSGSLIAFKSWKQNMSFPASLYQSFTNNVECTKLDNGNYCVYGQLFGDYDGVTYQSRFGVLEFNNALDFVQGYNINSTRGNNHNVSRIKVNRLGQATFSLTGNITYPDQDKYIGTAENGFIINQRRKEYRSMPLWYDILQSFDDRSFAYMHSMSTTSQSQFYLEYSLFHNSDTGSACLGLRDQFASTSPVTYIPYTFSWANIIPDPLTETNNQNNNSTPLFYSDNPPCYEKTFCDTVAIHGDSITCDLQQNLTFSAFKNAACGTGIQWRIDTIAIQSMQVVNDTTLTIQFMQPWQGWLYADINTSCGNISDSVWISILYSPGPVNLGPDTSICGNNTIILDAQSGYLNYLWNDGSTNSTLIVYQAGIYFVDAIDSCGSIYSDTIAVIAAPPPWINLGPDRSKCNDDTLHLVAPAGYLSYTWSPPYNINTLTQPQVIVQPMVDTFYVLRAEQSPGCFASDTIYINVNISPPIDLGSDTSICATDSLILNAGSGFSQFLWSTGNTSQTIALNSVGTYWAEGITAEGCKSTDTIAIMNIWNIPIITLDHNQNLCEGEARLLDPGNFASYLWQDGSTSATYLVNGPGTYFVIVWDNNGCRATDSVIITNLFPKPTNFLPPDTAICNYGRVLIQPNKIFLSYAWSNSFNTSSITVTTPGIYWLDVIDENNCSGKDTIKVVPKECLKGFYIPTGFTPNDNGLNDKFKPIIGGVLKQYRFTIYNRWGEIVFTTNDITRGWDGKVKGLLQESRVFVWSCLYQLEGEERKLAKGTVTLIR